MKISLYIHVGMCIYVYRHIPKYRSSFIYAPIEIKPGMKEVVTNSATKNSPSIFDDIKEAEVAYAAFQQNNSARLLSPTPLGV